MAWSTRITRSCSDLPTTLASLALISLVSPVRAAPQEMSVHLDETRQMIQQGRHAEALERLVWFYENALGRQPSIAGVRNSFALRDWQTLAGVYPEAKEALVRIRDARHSGLTQNPTNFQAFSDFLALNRVLDEPTRTLAFFEQVSQDSPDAARSLWTRSINLRRLALESRRLDLIQAHGVDLLREFERGRALDERVSTLVARRPDIAQTITESRNRAFVTESLLLIEIALALNDSTTAKTIQGRALAIVPDERIRSAVPPEA